MQDKAAKKIEITKNLGKIISKLRNKANSSGRKFAYEYGISRSNLNKIENGIIDCRFTTLWEISEALGMKPSKLVKLLEDEMPKDFTLIDE